VEIKYNCSTITDMKEYTIVFIGKSGSGKGTQIKKLTDFLNSIGETSIEYVQSGQGLRNFIASDTYTSKLTQTINTQGKLYPTFVAIWSWVDGMIKNFSGEKILFVDGAPRKLNEALIMDEMFDFYERKNRYVINVEISDTWARERLKERGRGDDLKEESVTERLGWFRDNSPEILAFFEKTGKYKMITIKGEQDIESVQRDIVTALEL
jgi:adenylate kinase family enzyme